MKKAHIGKVPGIKEYLAEWIKDSTWGNEGYLADKGLIPMPKAERARYSKVVRNLTNLEL